MMRKAAAQLEATFTEGKVEDAAFLTFASGMLGAMPEELMGSVMEQLDIGKILSSLQAGGNQDIIDELLANAGGSTEDIVSGIDGENKKDP